MLLARSARAKILADNPKIALFCYDPTFMGTGLDNYFYFQLQTFLELLMFPWQEMYIKDRLDSNHRLNVAMGKYFFCLSDYLHLIEHLSPEYEHNQQTRIFIDCANRVYREMGIPLEQRHDFLRLPNSTGWRYSPFKEFFEKLYYRLIEKLSLLKKREQNRRDYVERQEKAYLSYAKRINKENPDLEVVHIKLTYLSESADIIETAKKDFSHLLENERRNSLFRKKIGYIARLDKNLGQGIHWDVLYFFKDANFYGGEGTFLENAIGIYWADEVTRGRGSWLDLDFKGYFYNILHRNPCGLIGNNPSNLRGNLISNIIFYMCESPLYFIPKKLRDEPRLLRRGNLKRSLGRSVAQ